MVSLALGAAALGAKAAAGGATITGLNLAAGGAAATTLGSGGIAVTAGASAGAAGAAAGAGLWAWIAAGAATLATPVIIIPVMIGVAGVKTYAIANAETARKTSEIAVKHVVKKTYAIANAETARKTSEIAVKHVVKKTSEAVDAAEELKQRDRSALDELKQLTKEECEKASLKELKTYVLEALSRNPNPIENWRLKIKWNQCVKWNTEHNKKKTNLDTAKDLVQKYWRSAFSLVGAQKIVTEGINKWSTQNNKNNEKMIDEPDKYSYIPYVVVGGTLAIPLIRRGLTSHPDVFRTFHNKWKTPLNRV